MRILPCHLPSSLEELEQKSHAKRNSILWAGAEAKISEKNATIHRNDSQITHNVSNWEMSLGGCTAGWPMMIKTSKILSYAAHICFFGLPEATVKVWAKCIISKGEGGGSKRVWSLYGEDWPNIWEKRFQLKFLNNQISLFIFITFSFLNEKIFGMLQSLLYRFFKK